MLPAIVSVPVRDDDPVLAATVKLTLPFPDPDAPAVTEIHVVLLLTAVHVQPAVAVTVLLPVPPVGVNDWLVGDIVRVAWIGEGESVGPEAGGASAGPDGFDERLYRTPFASGVGSRDTKSRRIIPSAAGAGFPRSTVCTGEEPPARKT